MSLNDSTICACCGRELKVRRKPQFGRAVYLVEPCKKCVEDSYLSGSDEGYQEGLDRAED